MRGGTEGGGARGGRNTRWQREEVESMWYRDADGVRAELLAQKEIHQMEIQTWRHPLARLATIWAGWRRRLWRS